MKFLNLYIVIILFTINNGCKNDAHKKVVEKQDLAREKIIEVVKIEPKELISKAFDTITSKNAIDFLIAYGKRNKANKVLIKTRLGNLTIQLYDDTPLHRANFIFLTEAGYFNTTCFHRVVSNFIVQGGNSENSNTLRIRNKYQNYTVPREFRKHRKHKYGAMAAARDWENNISKKSTPFEFYFIQDKHGAHHLDGEHTVFGELISGFNVLDKIANLKAGRDEWPLEDVFIETEIIK